MKTSRLIIVPFVLMIGMMAVLLSSPSAAYSSPEFLGITLTPTIVDPTAEPTTAPTSIPTALPTAVLTATPTPAPTLVPTATPTATPISSVPSEDPLESVVFLPPAGYSAAYEASLARNSEYLLGSSARLVIPALGMNAQISGIVLDGYTWDIRNLGPNVGWLSETAHPAQPGNVVLVGHVSGRPGGAPFAKLSRLELGQRIVVMVGGDTYVYRISGMRVVDPRDTSVLRSDGRRVLTLITCATYNAQDKSYANRLIVTAELAQSTAQTVTAE